MTSIDPDALTQVSGGAAASRRLDASEYARCVDSVVAGEQTRLPSTRPGWNPFATDKNQPPREKATLDRIRSRCGVPPA